MSERNREQNPPAQRSTDRSDQARGLLELAAEVQALLVPVQPTPAARRRMRDELVAQAGRRAPGKAKHLFQQYRRVILISAAALGSLASIVGVVAAIMQRNRHARSSHAPLRG